MSNSSERCSRVSFKTTTVNGSALDAFLLPAVLNTNVQIPSGKGLFRWNRLGAVALEIPTNTSDSLLMGLDVFGAHWNLEQ